jgi:hypothetical protein
MFGRKPAWYFLLAALLLTLSVLGVGQSAPGIPIGAASVKLDYSVVNLAGQVDAFIPTGSDSSVCLVTFGDSNIYAAGPSPAICVQRTFQEQKGIRIIVIPYFGAIPTDLTLNLTIYQLGAHGYGQPVLYTGP